MHRTLLAIAASLLLTSTAFAGCSDPGFQQTHPKLFREGGYCEQVANMNSLSTPVQGSGFDYTAPRMTRFGFGVYVDSATFGGVTFDHYFVANSTRPGGGPMKVGITR